MPWGRMQRIGAVALLLLSCGLCVARCALSPAVPFVWQSATAPWIMAPLPVSAALEQWGRREAPLTSFSRSVELAAPVAEATLSLRTLGRSRVSVNGSELPDSQGDTADWRRFRDVDVTGALHAGANSLRVDVENARGPALLALRLTGLGAPLASDTRWQVSRDGVALGDALLADDTRINPVAFAAPTPLRALGRTADTLLFFFTLGGLAFLARRRLPPRIVKMLPAVALGAAGLAWIALFLTKFASMPLSIGFDANHHRAYVDFLRAGRGLPFATDGWSMYHPPLFYAVAALVSDWGELALKFVPFLCGLGNLWVARALAARLFEGDIATQTLAVGFAATLPMNLYAAAYFSNEGPHAFLVGAALVAGVDALRRSRLGWRHAVMLGIWLGLAALTKFTALAVAAVAFFFLLCKLVAVERAPLGRSAALLATAVASFAAIAGWFYLRNALHFGTPLVGNWNLPDSDQLWWQQPGFHTAAWYTGFGEALRHPYLSGFHSFWDGIYSTLWGDGGIAGRALPSDRHSYWNYELMSVGYLLALPATAVLIVGALRCVAIALSRGDPGRRAALSFVTTVAYAIGFSIFAMTLALPFFAQAKAFYGLCALGPLAVFFAAGARWVDATLAARGWTVLRAAGAGWLCALFAVFYLSYAG